MNSYTCRNTGLKSFQKWKIGNDIRTIMLADTVISSMVDREHIYPIVAPENTIGDFIVYRRDSYSKSSTKMGVVEDDCVVAITVISDDYDNSVELAEAIDNCIYGTHTNTVDGDTYKFECSLEDSTEAFDDNKYIQTLLYKIK